MYQERGGAERGGINKYMLESNTSSINHSEQKKAIQVSIPEFLLKEVDDKINRGKVKISRNLWIVDAIVSKLENP